MANPARGARVHVPPPLIFAGGLLASWLLHRRLGFEIDGAGAGSIQRAAGVALIAGGLVLMAWAIRTLLGARTTILPHHPVRQVVTRGPYRFTRNPIYLGMTVIYLGVAALLNAAWPLVLLPFVIVLVTSLVISPEERYLRASFGAEYESYCRRVRRWL